MDWTRIDREANKCPKIILKRVDVNDDDSAVELPENNPNLTPLERLRLKQYGEQFYIAELLRRDVITKNIDVFLANMPLFIVSLYTDFGLDAEYLNTLPKFRPQMPPKLVREKTDKELMMEYEAWAERKKIMPRTKRPRKQKEKFHQVAFPVDEILGFRVTPDGFQYLVKWKDYSMFDMGKELESLSDVRNLVRNFWDRFFASCFRGFCNLESTFPFARPDDAKNLDDDAIQEYVTFLKSLYYEPILENQQTEISALIEDEESEYEDPVLDLPPELEPESAEEELSEPPSPPDTSRRYPKRKRKKLRKSLADYDGPKKARSFKKPRRSPSVQVNECQVSDEPVQAQEQLEAENTRENEPEVIQEPQVQEDLESERSEQAAPLDSSEEVAPELPPDSETNPSAPKDGENVKSSLKDKKLIVCKFEGCELTFPNSRRMWAHHNGKHKNNDCPICEKKFTLQKYGTHLAVCLGQQHSIRLANTCETCQVVFEDNKLKKAHVDKQKVKCSCSDKLISFARRRKAHQKCEKFEIRSCPPI